MFVFVSQFLTSKKNLNDKKMRSTALVCCIVPSFLKADKVLVAVNSYLKQVKETAKVGCIVDAL